MIDESTTEHRRFKLISLGSVDWAHHVALTIERRLRNEPDAGKRSELKNLRDWHYAQLRDDQIARKPHDPA